MTSSHRLFTRIITATCAALVIIVLGLAGNGSATDAADVLTYMDHLTRSTDRSTGSEGERLAARYIADTFRRMGLSSVGTQPFFLPLAEKRKAAISTGERTWAIFPWGPNMATLPKTPAAGISGPLIDVGDGSLAHFDGRPITGSIVLMDMASRQNWLFAAMFGARALVFIGDPQTTRIEFREKQIPTPLLFPRFWVPAETGKALRHLAATKTRVTLYSDTRWHNRIVRNVFGAVEGRDPKLKEQVVVIQAHFDASGYLLGRAPGADEATSAAVLLSIAQWLVRHPPKRTVILVATTGYGQGLAGMRHFMWSATGRRKDINKERRYLRDRKKRLLHLWNLLQKPDPLALKDPQEQDLVWAFVVERAKDAADYWTRQLQYRKTLEMRSKRFRDVKQEGKNHGAPKRVLESPRPYRRLSWKSHVSELTPPERVLASRLIAQGLAALRAEIKEIKRRQKVNKAQIRVKRLVGQYDPALFLSLSLTSRSLPCGLVEWGATYPLRDRVTRQLRAYRLAGLLQKAGANTANRLHTANLIQNTSRTAQNGTVVGTPPFGLAMASDVAAIAARPAVSLVSLNDQRYQWGTPNDTPDKVNRANLRLLARFLPLVIGRICSHPRLVGSCRPGIRGLAGIRGQAMFVRQGELFADQPAPGTLVSAIQGTSIFRTMVYRDGTFFLTGIANKKVAFQKVILEPYGIDPESGRIAWTADKVQTGKKNYRIKMKSRVAATALTMFHCEQSDVIGCFDPQKWGYLTKVKLLDGITEARPTRLWYSRVDGRDTMAITILLEKGSRFKLVLSDTLLRKELLLINGSAKNPLGIGFPIGTSNIPLTPLQTAKDLHYLVAQRLGNLTRRGIVNRYLQDLNTNAARELEKAQEALRERQYSTFWKNIVSSWAKLDRIYTEVESTQRDVLTGVMFFIALFVPFAYCMERYLFCFRTIYQQVVAFFTILVATIFTIRALHPAFQLTYNPMVVIIAFFIVGLSLLVSSIIFARFEREMAESRRHTDVTSGTASQVNKWQAFGAGFTIGASNLNRRKLRTALTCLTLIILTFTVMSFTNVKSLQKTTLTRIGDREAYRGVLLHHHIWRSFTPLSLEDLKTRFTGWVNLWPRAWIEPPNPFNRTLGVLAHGARNAVVEGVLGLGINPPQHFRRMVAFGRWFQQGERRSILVPIQLAGRLGLNPKTDLNATVLLWNEPFTVVGYFDGRQMESTHDLDGNRITPAYLEMAADQELSEVEVEAMQSGEQLQPMIERFRFSPAGATVIIPFGTCIRFGGELKAISILPKVGYDPTSIADSLSKWLVYPLFVGENGTWYHSASRTLKYQGVANIFVPILIVVFICLNTMIGHVHERQREISVYTSVGLAPAHVGFLFIVEALSLAVLSTVIGYILAQISAKYLGHSALFSQLTFNYSSLSSIACMFLVFAVVFLASLYPARVAARMAMPDVTRTWKVPEPENETITLTLPFLVKNEEEAGIMSFLTDFFASHQDVAHGTFIVQDATLDYQSPVVSTHLMPSPICLLLRADVWLAPFDFGIKQRIHLHCCPSEENPGYLEIAIRMIRLSGEQSSWIRTNLTFIKALRKQMLLWRLLDEETKSRYVNVAHEPAGPLRNRP